MLKSHSRGIEITHKLLDLFLINLAWWISYYIRFETHLLEADSGLAVRYLKFSVLLTVLTYYFLRREGVYGSKRFEPVFKEVFSIIKANTLSFTIFVFLTYFISGHKLSRLFIISQFCLSTLFLVSLKLFVRNALRELRKRGKNIRFTLLIGDSPSIQDYQRKISVHSEFGIQIKKWIKDSDNINHLTLKDIESLNPDSIIIGIENRNYYQVDKLLHILNNTLYEIVVLPDLSQSFIGYQIRDVAGTTAILINEPNIRSRSVIMKRVFDIIMSATGLILISPFMLLIALLVKLTSKGPIFYSQIRMGLDGQEFKMYKFRSMTVGSTNKETWTVKDDPRATKIGRILRKTSMDELPQLFNVLLGDMSLVGPRPERPIFVDQFRQKIPTYMLRHKMKAGMTGWAQVNGWRGDTSIEKRIECDLYYIKYWSIWMDLWIIFMTIWRGLINRNAY